jgi:transcriptional regulator GlxA family with amidase domain
MEGKSEPQAVLVLPSSYVLPETRVSMGFDPRLVRVLTALDLVYPAAPERAAAARAARCSVKTLDRLFTTMTGRAYARWLDGRRVRVADPAYDRGRGSMREIAAAIRFGFRTDARMRRAFERELGRKPSER